MNKDKGTIVLSAEEKGIRNCEVCVYCGLAQDTSKFADKHKKNLNGKKKKKKL